MQQTLSEFLHAPFGRQDLELKKSDYDRKYNEYLHANKIRMEAFTEVEGTYYYHLTVPSESAKDSGYRYDVAIRFYAPDEKVRKENTLKNYYVQFFSNSPSFIYKYAVLYKRNGALIENLYDKLNPEYADTLPETTNKTLEVSFDKSIYFTVRFLLDHSFRYLTKIGMILRLKKSTHAFFSGIRDVETIRLERMLISEEKRLQREEKRYKEKKGPKAPADPSKRNAIKDTLADKSNPGIRVVTPKKAGKRTSGISASRKVTKKRATRTTYRPM